MDDTVFHAQQQGTADKVRLRSYEKIPPSCVVFMLPCEKEIFLSQFLICSHYTLDLTLEKNPSGTLIGKCWEASFLKRKRQETSFVGRKKLGSQSCSKEKMGSQFRSRKKMTSQFCRRKKKIMFLRKDVNLTTCSIVSES